MTISPTPRLFNFVGGDAGSWRVVNIKTIVGEPIAEAAHLYISAWSNHAPPASAKWSLRGITSNDRYVIRDEKTALVGKQEGLGRPASTCGALILIRKNVTWWALTQDERREIFEAQSAHIAIGMKYLPAIARRLHHCRDLSATEPFDFLTWFEFAPTDETAFDALLGELRSSPEWRFVEREIDIRVVNAV